MNQVLIKTWTSRLKSHIGRPEPNISCWVMSVSHSKNEILSILGEKLLKFKNIIKNYKLRKEGNSSKIPLATIPIKSPHLFFYLCGMHNSKSFIKFFNCDELYAQWTRLHCNRGPCKHNTLSYNNFVPSKKRLCIAPHNIIDQQHWSTEGLSYPPNISRSHLVSNSCY